MGPGPRGKIKACARLPRRRARGGRRAPRPRPRLARPDPSAHPRRPRRPSSRSTSGGASARPQCASSRHCPDRTSLCGREHPGGRVQGPQILSLLATDGRMSFTDLGKATDLSTSAVHQRVKRLEQRGLIKGYGATVDHDQLGRPRPRSSRSPPIDPSQPDDYPDRLVGIREIESCWSVAGEESYILKIRVATPATSRTCSPASAAWPASRPAPRSSSPPPTRAARSTRRRDVVDPLGGRRDRRNAARVARPRPPPVTSDLLE